MPDLSLSDLAKVIDLKQVPLDRFVAEEVLKLFKWSVGATVIIVVLLAGIDTLELLLCRVQPDQRLINEHVILALIGASIVQVGAASAAIVYSLFKKPPEPGPEPE